MNPEQYAASQAVITAGVAAYVRRMASLFVGAALTPVEWLKFLALIFPEVERSYRQSAELGRSFYDSQRQIHHPELPRNDRLLSETNFQWFVKNMEPARKAMSQADSPKSAVTKVTLTAVREVEMAGRRQVIGAVKDDAELEAKVEKVQEQAVDDSGAVIGWARVATGRETCAWCLMLISRGAELNHKGNFAYQDAEAAGLNLDDETVLDLYAEAGGNLVKFKELLYDDEDDDPMERWHTGCDCIAVPVFNLNDWPGRNSAKRALELWVDASKEAAELIESGKSRTKNKNTETLNALRRRLDRGEILMSDYAFAA